MLANLLGILFLAGVGSYIYRSIPVTPTQQSPFNIQDGKQRSLQARGDAGLYIEKVRRKAIKSVGLQNPQNLRETPTQLGSATGILETFMYSV